MSTGERVWHEVECGGYAADLALWERAGRRADGPVLELGSGTGRVALHLARRGSEVVGGGRRSSSCSTRSRRRPSREGLDVARGTRRRARPGARAGVRADHRPDAARADAGRQRRAPRGSRGVRRSPRAGRARWRRRSSSAAAASRGGPGPAASRRSRARRMGVLEPADRWSPTERRRHGDPPAAPVGLARRRAERGGAHRPPRGARRRPASRPRRPRPASARRAARDPARATTTSASTVVVFGRRVMELRRAWRSTRSR